VERAKTIIAEIDRDMIRTCGDTSLHVSEVDYLVDITSTPLSEEEVETIVGRFASEKQSKARQAISYANPRTLRNIMNMLDHFEKEYIELLFHLNDPSDEVKAIGEYLKTILNDRDTIQIGVGSISGHMIELGVFDDLEDIGIWSEVGAPGMGFLVKRGIATGKYSTLHPGKAVFTTLAGMRGEEIEWANNNPLIELQRADYVVNIANISRIENMVAINNVTQVDLTGQITCETQFGPRLINGPGGQPEFHIGAFFAPGGRAVSLMLSTWGGKAVSTIVPYLDYGSIVTIPRTYADIVITEYGVADLVGKTHRERARELIRIAHPDLRPELEKAAKDIH
jgi:4-hydroxybutyrate CoA-transferase